MFNFLAPLFDFRALAAFDQAKSRDRRERSRHFVEESLEVRLARLCLAGKMNGLTDYQLAILILPRLKAEIGMKSSEENLSVSWIASEKKKLSSILFFVIFLAVVLGSLIILCTPCQRFSRMLGRRALFKLEPYWDWQEVYYSRCLLPKDNFEPFWTAKKFSTSTSSTVTTSDVDCDYCEEVTEITQLNLSTFSGHRQRTEAQFAFNIANKIPFIYDDRTLAREIEEWPLSTYSTVHHWMEFFKDDQQLRICMFKCSLVSATHPSHLFADLYAFCPLAWYAHWENCGIRTTKKLRTLIRRPSALPAMVELSKPSWVLLSGSTAEPQQQQESSFCDVKSSPAGKSYKLIKPLAGTDLLIVVQVQGRIQLKLTPTRSQCFADDDQHNSNCQSLAAVSLRAGQMAVVNAKYWSLSYRPVTSAAASTTEECSSNEKEEATFNLSIILAGIHI